MFFNIVGLINNSDDNMQAHQSPAAGINLLLTDHTNDQPQCSKKLEKFDPDDDKSTTKKLSQKRPVKALCFIGDSDQSPLLSEIMNDFNDETISSLKILRSADGTEYKSTAVDEGILFVMHDFLSSHFNYLRAQDLPMAGVSYIIKKLQAKQIPMMPRVQRPIFCDSMRDVICCISGIVHKKQICELVDRVHFMGGSVRAQPSNNTKMIIAVSTQTDKYRHAVATGLPIVHPDWVHDAWMRRYDPDFNATTKEFLASHRLKPFYGLTLTFFGHDQTALADMLKYVETYGGKIDEAGSDATTHFIVYKSYHDADIQPPSLNCHCVDTEWFWMSIQFELCANEQLYPAGHMARAQYLRRKQLRQIELQKQECRKPNAMVNEADDRVSPPPRPLSIVPDEDSQDLMSTNADFKSSRRSVSAEGRHRTPAMSQKVVKSPDNTTRRSRMKLLAGHNDTSMRGGTSTSSINDMSSDPLPDHMFSTEDSRILSADDSPARFQPPRYTKRQQVALELYETEKNYLLVLENILNISKSIDAQEATGHPLLERNDKNTIFGKIQPIYNLHTEICAKLRDNVMHWHEERLIGDIFNNQSAQLVKAYPPFVNDFDRIKETLNEADKNIAKFHAFLQIQQSQKAMQRQTLAELLIRPVQRLPSVQLLLADLHKRTSKENPDNYRLQLALAAVKSALNQINDKKRQTEDSMQAFEVFRDIEHLPPEMVSAQRQLVTSIDAIDLLGTFSTKKMGHVTIFLFNDSLVIAKRRDKSFRWQTSSSITASSMDISMSTTPVTPTNSLVTRRQSSIRRVNSKSPTPTIGSTLRRTILKRSNSMNYKHLRTFTLSSVKRVIDAECFETDWLFLLTTRSAENADETSAFLAYNCCTRDEKEDFLRQTVQHVNRMVVSAQLSTTSLCGDTVLSASADDAALTNDPLLKAMDVWKIDCTNDESMISIAYEVQTKLKRACDHVRAHNIDQLHNPISISSQSSFLNSSKLSISSATSKTQNQFSRSLSLKPGGTLRRAVSTVSIGIQNQLSKLHSRSRLPLPGVYSIGEQDENVTPNSSANLSQNVSVFTMSPKCSSTVDVTPKFATPISATKGRHRLSLNGVSRTFGLSINRNQSPQPKVSNEVSQPAPRSKKKKSPFQSCRQ